MSRNLSGEASASGLYCGDPNEGIPGTLASFTPPETQRVYCLLQRIMNGHSIACVLSASGTSSSSLNSCVRNFSEISLCHRLSNSHRYFGVCKRKKRCLKERVGIASGDISR